MTEMVIRALAAAMLYGIQSVVLKTWLMQFSAPVLLVWFYVIGLVISLILLAGQGYVGRPIVFPTGSLALASVMAGAAYCLADYQMIGSLRLATSVAVTSILLLIPVFAGVGTIIAVHATHANIASALPNRYEVMTFILVVAALAVFQKGQEVRAAKPEVAVSAVAQ